MARKRAPGGGRKPRGQYKGNSASLAVRVHPQTREGLLRAAEQHDRSISQEMQNALRHWIECSEVPHIAVLAQGVMFVARELELTAGRRYLDDSVTAGALKSSIGDLVQRLVSVRGDATDPNQAKRVGKRAANFVAATDPKRAKRVGKQAVEFVAAIFGKARAGHPAILHYDDWLRALSKGGGR